VVYCLNKRSRVGDAQETLYFSTVEKTNTGVCIRNYLFTSLKKKYARQLLLWKRVQTIWGRSIEKWNVKSLHCNPSWPTWSLAPFKSNKQGSRIIFCFVDYQSTAIGILRNKGSGEDGAINSFSSSFRFVSFRFAEYRKPHQCTFTEGNITVESSSSVERENLNLLWKAVWLWYRNSLWLHDRISASGRIATSAS